MLPSRCDVLVVGAGPAGSACAHELARAGWDVLLVDQHVFPRDKVCGDGLIPDCHRALRHLGVYEQVAALWQPVGAVRCVAPLGHHVDVPAPLAVLPRKALDELLRQHAVAAGARFAAPWRFEAPLEATDRAEAHVEDRVENRMAQRVVGARLRQGNIAHEVRCDWVVLATGATQQAMLAAGLCERRTPSGMALRGYVQLAADAPRDLRATLDTMHIVSHKRLRGGYGWIFPAPDGRYNIGVGVSDSHHANGRKRDVNLRASFQDFCALHPPAKALLQHAQWVGDLKGAPLRYSLRGARRSRPGLLAVGEAIGSTYALSGEGIGKALETGILAARCLVAQRSDPDPAAGVDVAGVDVAGVDVAGVHAAGVHAAGADDPVCRSYQAAIDTLRPRFDLYERASQMGQRLWLLDVMIWRARHSERVRRGMAGVLQETSSPDRITHWRGLLRVLVE